MLRTLATVTIAVLMTLCLACDRDADPNQQGLELREQGELDAAVETFEDALDTWPDNAGLHYNLALTLQDRAQRDDDPASLEEASSHYARALSLQPEIGRAHTNRAILLAKLDRDDEALTHYDQALAQDPEDERARTNRANLYLRHGDHDDALAEFERLIADDPTLWRPHFGAARIHEMRGDDARAKQLARHAKTLTSDDDEVALIEAFLADH